MPALKIRKSNGNTVIDLKYKSHSVIPGKPALKGLPATFGQASDVATVIVELEDTNAKLSVAVSYSVFPKYNAIARSTCVKNHGEEVFHVDKAVSFSVDLPTEERDLLHLSGDWTREAEIIKKKVQQGVQG